MIVTGGVPMNAVASEADLERAVRKPKQCHRALADNLGKKIGEDARRQKCLATQKSAAHDIPNVRLSSLAAVVTHKVPIINDLSFDVQSREEKGGLNGGTDPDTVPQCLCAEALPKFLDELVTLRKKFPENEDTD